MVKKNLISNSLAIGLILCFLLTAGCEKGNEEADVVFTYTGSSFTDTGILQCLPGILCFTEFDSGEQVPLCSRPNCMHDHAASKEERDRCYAIYPGDIVTAFFWKQKIYVFSREGVNHIVVYQSNPDGTGRTKINETDFDINRYRPFVLNGVLYIPGNILYYADDGEAEEETDYFIAAYDLNKNTFSIVTDIHHDLGNNSLTGTYKEKLVYFLNEVNDSETQEEWISSGAYYLLDPQNGSVEKLIDQNDGVYYSNSRLWYFIQNGDEYTLHMLDLESNHTQTMGTTDSPVAYIIDGKLVLYSDLNDWQKQVVPSDGYQDYLIVLDTRGSTDRYSAAEGIIRSQDYLNSEDKIVYMKRVE